MEGRTHRDLDPELCGEPVEIEERRATVRLTAGERMRGDETGLVHGGFVFGLADHAAMLAVNQPTVVLGSCQARFLKPVKVGDELMAEAVVENQEDRRFVVTCEVKRSGVTVMSGEFVCYTPERHVLAAE